jgi:hypothetical protein
MTTVGEKPAAAPAGDDLDAPVWGADAISKEIKRTKQQTFRLAESGLIDVSKCGRLLVSTRRRLRRSLGVA